MRRKKRRNLEYKFLPVCESPSGKKEQGEEYEYEEYDFLPVCSEQEAL
jgi:hypothetical protein